MEGEGGQNEKERWKHLERGERKWIRVKEGRKEGREGERREGGMEGEEWQGEAR